MDSIFITACFHIAAQFQLIRMNIEMILKQPKCVPFTNTENKGIRQALIETMQDQIKLFELSDLFIKVFTSIIIMHFVSVALIIGIGSIDLLMV